MSSELENNDPHLKRLQFFFIFLIIRLGDTGLIMAVTDLSVRAEISFSNK